VSRPNIRRVSPRLRLSLRAAFCLTTPLVVGLIAHQRSYGTLVALGALWAVSQDGMDRWRQRRLRLLGVALAGGSGIGVGALFINHVNAWWALVVLYGAVALVAGVIEASLWATQGMYLLLGVILGGGLRFSDRIWQCGVAIALGGLWVYFVAGLTDRRSRRADQRICVASALRSLADLLSTIGTEAMDPARARAVFALDAAQDVVGTRRLDGADDEVVALHQCFVVALQLGEVTSYLVDKDERVDVSVVEALRHVATLVAQRTCVEATHQCDEYSDRFAISLTSASAPYIANAFRVPSPATMVATPPFRSTIARLPMVERLRFAALLSVAVVAATLLSRALEGPRGYWLPMSVAFIFRPDLGPVMRRAVARTIGTLAGVGIAALVALGGNGEVVLIVLCCAMAAAVPWAAQRSHALTVMVFTPIVFVFVGVLGPDQNLFGPRIVDTACAAGIVLAIDYVLWLHAPSLRPPQQLAQADRATGRYLATDDRTGMVARHSLRRNALRAVTNARSAIELARVEPHLGHDSSPDLDRRLEELVGRIDSHTAELIEGDAPARPDA